MAIICGTSPDFMDGLEYVDTFAQLPIYADLASRIPGAGKRMPPEFLLGPRMLEDVHNERVRAEGHDGDRRECRMDKMEGHLGKAVRHGSPKHSPGVR